MNSEAVSYKHNGVLVSIPKGFHGLLLLPERIHKYPDGHPCQGCPFTFHTAIPSCMFPDRKDGGCLWYDLKQKKRPPLPYTYREDQAAAERIFAFIEILKNMME